MLLEFLVAQPNMNGSATCPRKIIKEVIFVITRVIVQEFMNANEECELIVAIILRFEQTYS